MALSILNTRTLIGIEAVQVSVETHISNGLPAFTIVGLPETAVKESKERVRSALLNSGFDFPDRRITVNLAPAELPKAGGRFDLAIALSVLSASGQVNLGDYSGSEFHGELALDGSLKRVNGLIPAILAAKKSNRRIVLPEENCREQDLLSYQASYAARNLSACVAGLSNENRFRRHRPLNNANSKPCSRNIPIIKGHAEGKRALLVAAAGRHNLLMVGPPGSGKTLLANALSRLLPPLSVEQAYEVAAVYSLTSLGGCACGNWRCPPLRSPHHTASSIALSGGGNRQMPGEISLAHNGLLFLDEFPQFKPSVLDAMREPLESGFIVVSRANYRARFPASFQLVAAMNPCPCGFAGDPGNECRC
ncbi:MAG: YifB family Mg chelatase-like AAA ATPase, partial [Gammaproteobacteria bacterium]